MGIVNRAWIQQNLISGNTHWGIELRSGGTYSLIDSNKIGFTSAGYYLPNGEGGIFISSGSTTIISGNLIGNHDGYEAKGIYLLDGTILPGSTNNCLLSNFYGLYSESGSGSVFENNWWGHSSGPMVSTTTWGDPLAGPTSASVDYLPFTSSRPSPRCPISRLSLLRNGSFESDSDGDYIPDYWTRVSLTPPTDAQEWSAAAYTGDYVMTIHGSPGVSKQLKQTLSFSGGVGDGFILLGESTGHDVPTSGNYYMSVSIRCTDGTPRTSSTYQFPSGSFPYTTRSSSLTAPCAYNQVEVVLYYQKDSGTAMFDEIKLTVLPAS